MGDCIIKMRGPRANVQPAKSGFISSTLTAIKKAAMNVRLAGFDRKLRRIHYVPDIYYTKKDVETLVRRGRRLLLKYGDVMDANEKESVKAATERYEQVLRKKY